MSTATAPSTPTALLPVSGTATLTPTWSPRRAALIGGIALALMAVFSAFGVFGAITPLITPGDAEKTAAAIIDSELLFRSGIASLIVVVMLDLIAASALFWVFRPVSASISAMATWFRMAYAAVFLVAILQLPIAVTLLDEPELALRAIDAFYTIWQIGLILFGIDLMIYGYLAYRSGFMAKIFGIVLVIAGVGYVGDGLGLVLVAGFTPTFGAFTFGGEVALFFWLLIRGRKLPH
jgi:hypothetical protein